MLTPNYPATTTSPGITAPRRPLALAALWLALPLAACGGATDSEGRRIPADAQVIADLTPADTRDVIDVDVVAGRSGEAYLHDRDLEWYFDRGVVVKRKANLDGAPDAIVVVGGLARYVWTGDRYEYRTFLTTYNEYEGIPGPDDDELLEYVRNHLDDVFVSRGHTIVDIESVEADGDTRVWHSATSFTSPFSIAYRYVKNDTTIEARQDRFDVRFYRDSIDSPIRGLMATETSRRQLGEEHYDAREIRDMKTLRTGFQ